MRAEQKIQAVDHFAVDPLLLIAAETFEFLLQGDDLAAFDIEFAHRVGGIRPLVLANIGIQRFDFTNGGAENLRALVAEHRLPDVVRTLLDFGGGVEIAINVGDADHGGARKCGRRQCQREQERENKHGAFHGTDGEPPTRKCPPWKRRDYQTLGATTRRR